MGAKQAVEQQQKVGNYRLVHELASGGMASVYLAQHESWTAEFSKRVAIKLVHPHLLKDPAFVRMFLDEARVSLLVNHPNVCSVLEVGVDAGAYFLVLEYLQGASLSHLLKLMKVAARPADLQYFMARVIAEAAEGLHAAHEALDPDGQPLDIVHRDVSPHNIMVTRDGAVKVVDFGIARAKERLEHTDTGFVKGKVAYLAPEQISGGPIDRRADIWALGVCLWEGLMLENPFQRNKDTAQTMSAITSGVIEGPRGDWIHPELVAIVQRSVRREVTGRYTSAREMSLALRTFLAKREMVFEAPQLSRSVLDLMPDLRKPSKLSPMGKDGEAKSDPFKSVSSSKVKPRKGLAFAVALCAFGLITIAAAPMGEWSKTPASSAPTQPVPAPAIVTTDLPPDLAEPVKFEAPAGPSAMVATRPARDVPAPMPSATRVAPSRPAVERVAGPSKGTLRVFAQAGQAEVRIDGEITRLTPARFELAPGSHHIELRKVGSGEFAEQSVSIVGGVETTLNVAVEE